MNITDQTLSKILKRLSQLEHRVEATDDKIRVSEQLVELKYMHRSSEISEIKNQCELMSAHVEK